MSPAKQEPTDPTLARLDGIARRLDAIIALLLRSNSPSTSDQIKTLSSIGFKPPEIGRIVGKEPNYVGAVLSNSKASSKAKKRGAAKKAKGR
jgi:hypothetical protein